MTGSVPSQADALWMRFMLRVVRNTGIASAYKEAAVDLLRLRPGETVIDIGCGLGDDANAMAELVGPNGLSIGLDRIPPDADSAARTLARFVLADGAAIPLPSRSVHAVRVDRVLHLLDPAPRAAVVRDVARVLRPGGRAVIAEPDNGSLAFPGLNDEVSQALAGERARDAFSGVEPLALALRALAADAGLEPAEWRDVTTGFTDFALFQHFFRLRAVLKRLVTRGAVTQSAADGWWSAREADDRANCFRASFSGHILLVQQPSPGALPIA